MAKRILKERTRNGGTETESKHMSNIRGMLRRMTRFWKPKQLALKAASKIVISGGKKSLRYKCKNCSEWYGAKSVEVNHIIPAGSLKSYADLPAFCEKLFVEDINLLEVLCKDCHAKITKEQREK
jgi:hypothetical protein